MKQKYNGNQLEYIGAKVVENWKEKQKWIDDMRPIWIAEGKQLKALRKKLKVAHADISGRINISATVLRKLEAGEPVERRPLVYSAYRAVLQLIVSEHRLAMQDFLSRPM